MYSCLCGFFYFHAPMRHRRSHNLHKQEWLCYSRQMREFNSRGAKWDFGFDEDGRVGPVLGNPQPQPRVSQFLAVIEQTKAHAKGGEIPGRHADGSLWRIDPSNHVIEAPAIEYGNSQLRCVLPIRGAQII